LLHNGFLSMQLQVIQKKSSLELYLDDEMLKICDRKLFQKKVPKDKYFQDKKEATEWFYQLEKDVLLGFSYYLLGRRSYHSSVLKRKLILRNFSKASIEEIILLLKERRFLDDLEWMKFQIEKAQRKAHGPRKVYYQLYLQGINEEELKNALDKFYSPKTEKKIVQLLKQKLEKTKDKKEIYSYLKKRGFNLSDFFD